METFSKGPCVETSRGVETYDRRAINWGVCGKTQTFSKGTSTDTVALGFSAMALNVGPTHCVGAEADVDFSAMELSVCRESCT